MDQLEQVKILAEALRQIGAITVQPAADPIHALLEAQNIADAALASAGLEQQTGVTSASLDRGL